MVRPGRVLLTHVKLLCPLSTVMIGSKQFDLHHVPASLCANGSVHIWCVLHGFKGFVSHPQLLEAWNVAKAAEARPAVRPVAPGS
jgi:hypothetical protein